MATSRLPFSSATDSSTDDESGRGRGSTSISLSTLTDDEVAAILAVIQRDFRLRDKELCKISDNNHARVSQEEGNRVNQLLDENPNFNQKRCIRCCQSFSLFGHYQRVHCDRCKFDVCRTCVVTKNPPHNCAFCVKERTLQREACEWFYEAFSNKYRRFGAAKVLSSFLKESSPEQVKITNSEQTTAPTTANQEREATFQEVDEHLKQFLRRQPHSSTAEVPPRLHISDKSIGNAQRDLSTIKEELHGQLPEPQPDKHSDKKKSRSKKRIQESDTSDDASSDIIELNLNFPFSTSSGEPKRKTETNASHSSESEFEELSAKVHSLSARKLSNGSDADISSIGMSDFEMLVSDEDNSLSENKHTRKIMDFRNLRNSGANVRGEGVLTPNISDYDVLSSGNANSHKNILKEGEATSSDFDVLSGNEFDKQTSEDSDQLYVYSDAEKMSPSPHKKESAYVVIGKMPPNKKPVIEPVLEDIINYESVKEPISSKRNSRRQSEYAVYGFPDRKQTQNSSLLSQKSDFYNELIESSDFEPIQFDENEISKKAINLSPQTILDDDKSDELDREPIAQNKYKESLKAQLEHQISSDQTIFKIPEVDEEETLVNSQNLTIADQIVKLQADTEADISYIEIELPSFSNAQSSLIDIKKNTSSETPVKEEIHKESEIDSKDCADGSRKYMYMQYPYMEQCKIENKILGIEGHQLGIEGHQLGIEGQQLGIEGQQLGIEGHQLGIEGQQLGIEGQQLGIEGQHLGIEGQQLGIEGQQLGIERQQIRIQRQQFEIDGFQFRSNGEQSEIDGQQLENKSEMFRIDGQQLELEDQQLKFQCQQFENAAQHIGIQDQQFETDSKKLEINGNDFETDEPDNSNLGTNANYYTSKWDSSEERLFISGTNQNNSENSYKMVLPQYVQEDIKAETESLCSELSDIDSEFAEDIVNFISETVILDDIVDDWVNTQSAEERQASFSEKADYLQKMSLLAQASAFWMEENEDQSTNQTSIMNVTKKENFEINHSCDNVNDSMMSTILDDVLTILIDDLLKDCLPNQSQQNFNNISELRTTTQLPVSIPKESFKNEDKNHRDILLSLSDSENFHHIFEDPNNEVEDNMEYCKSPLSMDDEEQFISVHVFDNNGNIIDGEILDDNDIQMESLDDSGSFNSNSELLHVASNERMSELYDSINHMDMDNSELNQSHSLSNYSFTNDEIPEKSVLTSNNGGVFLVNNKISIPSICFNENFLSEDVPEKITDAKDDRSQHDSAISEEISGNKDTQQLQDNVFNIQCQLNVTEGSLPASVKSESSSQCSSTCRDHYDYLQDHHIQNMSSPNEDSTIRLQEQLAKINKSNDNIGVITHNTEFDKTTFLCNNFDNFVPGSESDKSSTFPKRVNLAVADSDDTNELNRSTSSMSRNSVGCHKEKTQKFSIFQATKSRSAPEGLDLQEFVESLLLKTYTDKASFCKKFGSMPAMSTSNKSSEYADLQPTNNNNECKASVESVGDIVDNFYECQESGNISISYEEIKNSTNEEFEPKSEIIPEIKVDKIHSLSEEPFILINENKYKDKDEFQNSTDHSDFESETQPIDSIFKTSDKILELLALNEPIKKVSNNELQWFGDEVSSNNTGDKPKFSPTKENTLAFYKVPSTSKESEENQQNSIPAIKILECDAVLVNPLNNSSTSLENDVSINEEDTIPVLNFHSWNSAENEKQNNIISDMDAEVAASEGSSTTTSFEENEESTNQCSNFEKSTKQDVPKVQSYPSELSKMENESSIEMQSNIPISIKAAKAIEFSDSDEESISYSETVPAKVSQSAGEVPSSVKSAKPIEFDSDDEESDPHSETLILKVNQIRDSPILIKSAKPIDFDTDKENISHFNALASKFNQSGESVVSLKSAKPIDFIDSDEESISYSETSLSKLRHSSGSPQAIVSLSDEDDNQKITERSSLELEKLQYEIILEEVLEFQTIPPFPTTNLSSSIITMGHSTLTEEDKFGMITSVTEVNSFYADISDALLPPTTIEDSRASGAFSVASNINNFTEDTPSNINSDIYEEQKTNTHIINTLNGNVSLTKQLPHKADEIIKTGNDVVLQENINESIRNEPDNNVQEDLNIDIYLVNGKNETLDYEILSSSDDKCNSTQKSEIMLDDVVFRGTPEHTAEISYLSNDTIEFNTSSNLLSTESDIQLPDQQKEGNELDMSTSIELTSQTLVSNFACLTPILTNDTNYNTSKCDKSNLSHESLSSSTKSIGKILEPISPGGSKSTLCEIDHKIYVSETVPTSSYCSPEVDSLTSEKYIQLNNSKNSIEPYDTCTCERIPSQTASINKNLPICQESRDYIHVNDPKTDFVVLNKKHSLPKKGKFGRVFGSLFNVNNMHDQSLKQTSRKYLSISMPCLSAKELSLKPWVSNSGQIFISSPEKVFLRNIPLTSSTKEESHPTNLQPFPMASSNESLEESDNSKIYTSDFDVHVEIDSLSESSNNHLSVNHSLHEVIPASCQSSEPENKSKFTLPKLEMHDFNNIKLCEIWRPVSFLQSPEVDCELPKLTEFARIASFQSACEIRMQPKNLCMASRHGACDQIIIPLKSNYLSCQNYSKVDLNLVNNTDALLQLDKALLLPSEISHTQLKPIYNLSSSFKAIQIEPEVLIAQNSQKFNSIASQNILHQQYSNATVELNAKDSITYILGNVEKVFHFENQFEIGNDLFLDTANRLVPYKVASVMNLDIDAKPPEIISVYGQKIEYKEYDILALDESKRSQKELPAKVKLPISQGNYKNNNAPLNHSASTGVTTGMLDALPLSILNHSTNETHSNDNLPHSKHTLPPNVLNENRNENLTAKSIEGDGYVGEPLQVDSNSKQSIHNDEIKLQKDFDILPTMVHSQDLFSQSHLATKPKKADSIQFVKKLKEKEVENVNKKSLGFDNNGPACILPDGKQSFFRRGSSIEIYEDQSEGTTTSTGEPTNQITGNEDVLPLTDMTQTLPQNTLDNQRIIPYEFPISEVQPDYAASNEAIADLEILPNEYSSILEHNTCDVYPNIGDSFSISTPNLTLTSEQDDIHFDVPMAQTSRRSAGHERAVDRAISMPSLAQVKIAEEKVFSKKKLTKKRSKNLTPFARGSYPMKPEDLELAEKKKEKIGFISKIKGKFSRKNKSQSDISYEVNADGKNVTLKRFESLNEFEHKINRRSVQVTPNLQSSSVLDLPAGDPKSLPFTPSDVASDSDSLGQFQLSVKTPANNGLLNQSVAESDNTIISEGAKMIELKQTSSEKPIIKEKILKEKITTESNNDLCEGPTEEVSLPQLDVNKKENTSDGPIGTCATYFGDDIDAFEDADLSSISSSTEGDTSELPLGIESDIPTNFSRNGQKNLPTEPKLKRRSCSTISNEGENTSIETDPYGPLKISENWEDSPSVDSLTSSDDEHFTMKATEDILRIGLKKPSGFFVSDSENESRVNILDISDESSMDECIIQTMVLSSEEESGRSRQISDNEANFDHVKIGGDMLPFNISDLVEDVPDALLPIQNLVPEPYDTSDVAIISDTSSEGEQISDVDDYVMKATPITKEDELNKSSSTLTDENELGEEIFNSAENGIYHAANYTDSDNSSNLSHISEEKEEEASSEESQRAAPNKYVRDLNEQYMSTKNLPKSDDEVIHDDVLQNLECIPGRDFIIDAETEANPSFNASEVDIERAKVHTLYDMKSTDLPISDFNFECSTIEEDSQSDMDNENTNSTNASNTSSHKSHDSSANSQASAHSLEVPNQQIQSDNSAPLLDLLGVQPYTTDAQTVFQNQIQVEEISYSSLSSIHSMEDPGVLSSLNASQEVREDELLDSILTSINESQTFYKEEQSKSSATDHVETLGKLPEVQKQLPVMKEELQPEDIKKIAHKFLDLSDEHMDLNSSDAQAHSSISSIPSNKADVSAFANGVTDYVTNIFILDSLVDDAIDHEFQYFIKSDSARIIDAKNIWEAKEMESDEEGVCTEIENKALTSSSSSSDESMEVNSQQESIEEADYDHSKIQTAIKVNDVNDEFESVEIHMYPCSSDEDDSSIEIKDKQILDIKSKHYESDDELIESVFCWEVKEGLKPKYNWDEVLETHGEPIPIAELLTDKQLEVIEDENITCMLNQNQNEELIFQWKCLKTLPYVTSISNESVTDKSEIFETTTSESNSYLSESHELAFCESVSNFLLDSLLSDIFNDVADMIPDPINVFDDDIIYETRIVGDHFSANIDELPLEEMAKDFIWPTPTLHTLEEPPHQFNKYDLATEKYIRLDSSSENEAEYQRSNESDTNTAKSQGITNIFPEDVKVCAANKIQPSKEVYISENSSMDIGETTSSESDIESISSETIIEQFTENVIAFVAAILFDEIVDEIFLKLIPELSKVIRNKEPLMTEAKSEFKDSSFTTSQDDEDKVAEFKCSLCSESSATSDSEYTSTDLDDNSFVENVTNYITNSAIIDDIFNDVLGETYPDVHDHSGIVHKFYQQAVTATVSANWLEQTHKDEPDDEILEMRIATNKQIEPKNLDRNLDNVGPEDFKWPETYISRELTPEIKLNDQLAVSEKVKLKLVGNESESDTSQYTSEDETLSEESDAKTDDNMLVEMRIANISKDSLENISHIAGNSA